MDFELGTNSFSGHIPNTFGNLRSLQWLSLAENLLTTESGTSNQCSFLTSLTNCRSLQHLDVGSNQLGCVLPPSIGNFSSSLEFLGVIDCRLKGHIPQGIVNLSGLTYLNIGLNQLVGTIPTRIGRLWQLEGLSFHSNNLQGSIPYNICHLQRLDGLYLYENQLSGNLPACLARLTSLRHLQLNSNRLNSSIPSSFWTLEYILSVDLSSNSFSGYLPLSIQNLKVLINLNLSSNQLSGKLPSTIGALKDLSALSLAGNRFEGPIPESFGSLTSLESLDLSDNHLSGEIPKSLVAISSLRQLNVSHNKLEGEIPTGGAFKNFSAGSFSWNHALCGPPRLQVPPCKISKTVARRILKYVLPPVISSVLVAIMVFIYCMRRQHMSRKGKVQEDLSFLATWRRISYLEIQQATEGFSGCNLLGTGSFGSVYRGTLSDGMNVAIKIFNQQSERAFRSFESECEILRNVRHRNLIKILSSCSNPDFKALVLEFMPNGSLEKWLYSHNYFLDILHRLSIMIDVGLAVEYLHIGHSSAPVVHCDLKPSNILLDEDMVAHVTDFGISKLLWEGDDTVTQTLTMATIGYMAPEYGSEGIVSARCDVYSYGILLMETFTRKKPTDEMFTEEMSFRNWVKNSLPHGLTRAVDANLVEEEQSFSAKMDCVLSVMHLALDCCREAPDQRIDMTEAVARLKKIKEKFVGDVRSN